MRGAKINQFRARFAYIWLGRAFEQDIGRGKPDTPHGTIGSIFMGPRPVAMTASRHRVWAMIVASANWLQVSPVRKTGRGLIRAALLYAVLT
jgi:hypothetical protein